MSLDHERQDFLPPEVLIGGRPEDCLAGGGELGALMRSMDWSRTPLGPVSRWPQSLRTSVSIMLSSGFAVVIAWGREHIFLYNDRYRPILGSTKHPMALGSRGADIFPEIWDFVGPLFRKTLAGETVALDDVLLPLDRNGYLEECYFTLSYSPIRDESGGIGGLLAIVAETTERVRGERRLRTLRDLASIAPRAHTAEEACRNAVRTFSENPTDVPFALAYLLDGEGAAPRLVAHTGLDGGPATAADAWPFAEAARTGQTVKVSGLATRFGPLPGGTYPEPTHTALVLPLARPGLVHPYGFLVAGVSPRRALDDATSTFFQLASEHVATAIANALSHEAERRRAEALAEIDRAKTTFFSNVSHEFRTPLTLMMAPIEELRAELHADHPGRERLELLHRNSLRLLKLVNTLLEFSRIEAGRVQASFEPTDLAALTADLASSFRSAVERAGLELVVDCPRLPEAIYVDHDMWEKIVLNLLSNAFKFTWEGAIAVRLRAIDGAVELEVQDSGIGIGERELPLLFARFHRIEGARSRSFEGSGIGLALVQELVRMHGGEIRVQSALGRGTAFLVRIPRGAAHLPAERIRAQGALSSTAHGAAPYVEEALRWTAAPEAMVMPEPAAAAGGGRERILVADDNSDMREYIARLLRDRWSVEVVADGRSALEAVRRSAPDLVVADVMMPGMTGFELLRALRSAAGTREIPVVLLSARAGEEATAEGLKAGADDYLVKPFTARELLVRVAARLASAKAARQFQEQRANLYRAFLQAPFPLAIFRGPEHVIDAANDAILKAWGKAPTILGRPLLEVLPELRDQRFPALLDEVHRTGVSYQGRAELARLPTGPAGALQDAYYNYDYAPVRDSHGAVEGIMVCAFEVTEQVRAQRSMHFLADASAVMASSLDYEKTLAEIVGLCVPRIADWASIDMKRADGTVGRLAVSHVDPKKVDLAHQLLRRVPIHLDDPHGAGRVIRTGRGEVFHSVPDSVLVDAAPDGETLQILRSLGLASSICVPITADGEPIGALSLVTAESRRLFGEDDLRLAEEIARRASIAIEHARLYSMFHELVENLPTLAWTARPDGYIDYYNRRWYDYTGTTFEQMHGWGWKSVHDPAMLDAVVERWQRSIETGEPFDMEFPLRGRDGVFRWFLTRVHPIRDARGSITRWFGTNTDIDERRRNDDFRDMFIGILGHDLRNPLNTIMTTARLLRLRKEEPARSDAKLERIVASSLRIQRMVEQLLDMTRARLAGGIPINRTAGQDLAPLIRKIVDELRAGHPDRVVEFRPQGPCVVAVDSDRLEQVVSNLVGNALTHGDQQRPITVTLSDDDRQVRIGVHNHGNPIDPSFMPLLFNPFARTEKPMGRSEGLGLGLYISERIVSAHGGRIEAESSLAGTRFEAILPKLEKR